MNNLPYIDSTSAENGLDEEFNPVPLEVAELVKYSYSVFPTGENFSVNEKATGIGDWKLTNDSYQNDQGLDIAVFRRDVAEKEYYIVVNVGSETRFETDGDIKEFNEDWKNNLQQPFGYSQDMKDSIEFARKFVDEHPDANIIFAGHSKGGAEAAANAVATGKKAILFNPAKVNLNAYLLDGSKYDGEMTSYIVDGEVLDYYTGFLPLEVPTERIIIGKYTNTSDPSFNERINRHGIDKIIEILKNKTE